MMSRGSVLPLDDECADDLIEDYSPLTPASLEQSNSQRTPDGNRNEEYDDDDEKIPMCSVLNTVIDHVMRPPTRNFEPEEFRQAQQQQQSSVSVMPPVRVGPSKDDATTTSPSAPILVPVLRVFGPILRRDRPVDHPPVQSACLHIHGAFPYLLARPRVAGPDGSIHHRVSHSVFSRSRNSQQLDWDDPVQVERFLPDLQPRLEAHIQAMTSSFSSTDKESDGDSKKEVPARIIRRMSVVMGRGFYTYCPGPTAPFIRVEYFNPDNRWKVKRSLESGLDSVPLINHPDPFQYDPFGRETSSRNQPRDSTPADEPEMETPNLLQFHCYEAHVPYTMQFMRDLNVAGMSYIHVKHGLFRNPLPKTLRPHYHPEYMKSCDAERQGVPLEYLFLESNTPSGPRWPQRTLENTHKHTHSHSQTSSSRTGSFETSKKEAPPAPSKDTWCDVELDVGVDKILNVLDVMTELPEDKDERDRVYWRAVPSLREIWKEERRRMSKLLPPADDFLSQAPKPAPAFTLTVKGKDAPIPGTRLAVAGMKNLVRVSDGLEESFDRSMKQILNRYRDKVEKVDQRLRDGGIMGAVSTIYSQEEKSGGIQLTPTFDETMKALEEMGGYEEHDLRRSSQNSENNQNELPKGNPSSYTTPKSKKQRTVIGSTEEKFLEATQYYYDPKRFSLSQEEEEEYIMSQRMDEGEAVVDGPFGRTDDFIDHETLRPYELLEDEDSIADEDHVEERELEKELSMMATQTLELHEGDDNNASHFFHQDSDHDQGDQSDEEPLADPVDTQPPAGEHSGRQRLTQEDSVTSLNPPTRGDIVKSAVSTRLLPLPQKRGTPDWLRHLHVYNNERKRWASSSTNLHSWFPEKTSGLASLTRCAPSRQVVCTWLSKKSNKVDHDHGNPRKKAKVHSRDALVADMRLDDNSRRLVASTKDSSREITSGHDQLYYGRQVEEVEWSCSQQPLSQNLSQEIVQPVLETSQQRDEESLALGESALESEMSSSVLTSVMTQNKSMEDDGGALDGMGNAGGRLWVAGGGQIKAKTRPSQSNTSPNPGDDLGSYLPAPITVMSIEVHVQCRTGPAKIGDSRQISMTPNSGKDKTSAVVFVVARDPGGGECLQYLERGVIYVPVEKEIPTEKNFSRVEKELAAERLRRSIPSRSMEVACPVSVECVEDESSLLKRFAAKVRARDPDMLLSWDPQGGGIGYLIERGVAIGKSDSGSDHPKEIDMVKLLGRAQNAGKSSGISDNSGEGGDSEKELSESAKARWKGSGMGADWDERVGAGVAAASIPGRLIFAAWKLVAEEVKHGNASYLPAIVSAVLGRRIPHHDNLVLTNWYGQNSGLHRWRVLHHRLTQAMCSLLLFDALDIIGRAGEAARLSGVEFLHSFPGIRGSQYKVEGVLLRALKSLSSTERGSKKGKPAKSSAESLSESTPSQISSPWKARRQRASSTEFHLDQPLHELDDRGYFFYSPSLRDADKQEALEVQALTLEPESGHYDDPVVVCDFTALYPSLMIAYNLCYSTCVSKLEYTSTREEMRMEGKTTGSVGPFKIQEGRAATVLAHHMKSLTEATEAHDRAYVAPTGTIYVAESVVKGVLPQVLDEMLSTRAMLKKAAKEYKRLVPDICPSILRQLEARQLALKYVANVTYGYTSATFSGRCACPVLADTIVECGRRTLKNAINLANSWGADLDGKWAGCKVLYGDTDSLFIRLPGRSVAEAFQFGEEFCKIVTAGNPPPVALKLEKVYLGCLLQTKKKYCGMKYESKTQAKPEFEAKGIETVRRDQCSVTQKVLRNSLVTLFTKGPDDVKKYLFRQWSLILSGELPVSDFILTGRVRSRYRGTGVGPVQAVLARRLAEADTSRVMRHNERIAYVIVATPGVQFKLRDGVVTPNEYLEQFDSLVLSSGYYLTKHVIPALQRCLGLAPHKIDVTAWFNSMPKPRRRVHFWPRTISGSTTGAITRFFANSNCALCGGPGSVIGDHKVAICHECSSQSLESLETAFRRLNLAQNESLALANQCSSCHLGYEDGGTYAVVRPSKKKTRASPGIYTPLASCNCIDCPVSFQRHRLREAEYAATELCKALGADEMW